MSKLQVSVLSFGKILLQKEVSMAVVPGFNGDIGIIPSERSFMYLIKPGILYLFNNSNVESRYFISSGKFSAVNDLLTITTSGELINLDALKAKEMEERNTNLQALLKSEISADLRAYYNDQIALNNLIIASIPMNSYR